MDAHLVAGLFSRGVHASAHDPDEGIWPIDDLHNAGEQVPGIVGATNMGEFVKQDGLSLGRSGFGQQVVRDQHLGVTKPDSGRDRRVIRPGNRDVTMNAELARQTSSCGVPRAGLQWLGAITNAPGGMHREQKTQNEQRDTGRVYHGHADQHGADVNPPGAIYRSFDIGR